MTVEEYTDYLLAIVLTALTLLFVGLVIGVLIAIFTKGF